MTFDSRHWGNFPSSLNPSLHSLITTRSYPAILHHAVALPDWSGPAIKLAVLSDFHICKPWSPISLLGSTIDRVNGLQPDLVLLAGDFLASQRLPAVSVTAHEVISELSNLRAQRGVFAVLGNHDWWDCQLARATHNRQNSVVAALENSPIHLLRNSAVQICIEGTAIWLVGFDSQKPIRGKHTGFHDPARAYAEVPAKAPSILLAHEPDYFALGDVRSSLQISGHTHGGQANLFGWRPLTPSKFGGRFAHGHIVEDLRHLIVSGGLGFSGLPMRIAQRPEITLVTVGAGK